MAAAVSLLRMRGHKVNCLITMYVNNVIIWVSELLGEDCDALETIDSQLKWWTIIEQTTGNNKQLTTTWKQ